MKKALFFSLFLGGVCLSYAAENSSSAKELADKAEAIYYPVKLTSSCGYVEYIEFNPAYDHPECLLVELQAMEDFCAAPVEDWGYA